MSDHPMMAEIRRQAHLRKTVHSVENSMQACCEDLKSRKIRHIIITGSGDSHYISLSVCHFFQNMCPECEIEMPTSLNFAKYRLHCVHEQTAVIAISISGNVVRTIECVEKSQERGAYVIGITNNRDSRLAQAAQRPVFLDLDTEPTWTCGTLTYLGSMYALARAAITLSSFDEEAKAQRLTELSQTLEKVEQVLNVSEEICKSAARNMRIIGSRPPFFVLGAGGNYGTAKYGAAKFMEVCSTLGIGQECEEFCHGEFWVIDRANPVFMIAPTGAGFERCCEVATVLRKYGCDLFVLSDDEALCALGKYAVRMPLCPEWTTPFLYALPFQFLAYYYSYEKGLNPDTRDHTDPFRKTCSRILTRGRDMVL